MSLVTDVPDELRFRGIEPRQDARSFTITLDEAEPWGGGRIAGRVVRCRVGARRGRRVGADLASVPLILRAPQSLPVVRVETSPIGTWRLLEWRSEEDVGGSGGPCSIVFEGRRPEDLPLAGETREAELARRNAA